MVYIEVYMSKPSIASKDMLLMAATNEKIDMEFVGRTEECVGTENPVFSVLVLLDFPMDITVVSERLEVSDVLKALGTTAAAEVEGTNDLLSSVSESSSLDNKVDRVIRMVVKVRAGSGSKNTEEYGRSHCMVSDLVLKAQQSHTMLKATESTESTATTTESTATTIGTTETSSTRAKEEQDATDNDVDNIEPKDHTNTNNNDRVGSISLTERETTQRMNIELPSKLVARSTKYGIRDDIKEHKKGTDGATAASGTASAGKKNNAPQLIVAPRWCEYASTDLASCRNMSSSGYTVRFFTYHNADNDEESDEEADSFEDEDEDEEEVVEVKTDAQTTDALSFVPNKTSHKTSHKTSNKALKKQTKRKPALSQEQLVRTRSMRSRRSRFRSASSGMSPNKLGQWTTMGLREELTEAFTTFETPTGKSLF